MQEYALYRRARTEWINECKAEIRKHSKSSIGWWNRFFLAVPPSTIVVFIAVRLVYGLFDVITIEEEYRLIRF